MTMVADNVRTQYQDGLVLGAAQLSGDQTYGRAALERRSLTRDAFGIAWGLELTVETAGAGSSSSSVVRVTPGVAYGGDGKAIVLREKGEVSSVLRSNGAQPNDSWAIYIAYTETAQSGTSGFSFCGQAMDPTIVEGTQFVAELFGAPSADGERDGPRVAPQGELGGASTPSEDRVQLGVVDFDASGQPSVRLTPGVVAIPVPTTKPTQGDLRKANAPPAEAEYIGVVAAGVAHPRAWASAEGATIVPAIELEPDGGIHLRQETVLHGDAHATGIVLVDRTVVTAKEGISCILPLNTGVLATAVVNMAVSYTTDSGNNVSAGIDLAGKSHTPSDDGPRVLGIAIGAHDSTGNARVVFSGLAVATLTDDPSTLVPGQWLVLDTSNPGQLTKPAGSLSAGSLVAKFLSQTSGQLASVLVCLS